MRPIRKKPNWSFLLLLLSLSLLFVSCGDHDKAEEDVPPLDSTLEEPASEPIVEAEAATMSLMKTEGTVGVSDGNGKDMPPFENMKLYSGYQLETQPVSYAWINLDRVKLAKMDENSEVGIRKEGKDLTIFLNAGGLYFNISEPLPEDETFNIRCSTMVVGIRGTCGWVHLLTPAHMQIHLLEGTVECQVTSGTEEPETITVSGGEMADLIVNDDGETEITILPFAENYVAPFVLEELKADAELCETILEVSGLNITDPPDPVERLKEEYKQIIADRPLHSEVSPGGLYYADYIDFQNDAIPELLLISDVGLEVFGDIQGHSAKYGEVPIDFNRDDMLYAYNTISLVYQGDKIAIEWYGESGWAVYSYTYYSVNENTFSAVDQVTVFPVPHGEDDGTSEVYTFDETAITSEQGDAIVAKYVENQRIATFSVDYPLEVATRGILPELPLDVQRRVAQVNVLTNNTPIYAELIDLNQDGVDELLVLNKFGQYNSYRWTAYLWDGAALQSNVLSCNAAEGITTDDLYIVDVGIYREVNTGALYVHYDGEVAGGFFVDCFVSLTDSVVIDQPFDGFIDSEEMWEEWAPILEQEERDYQAGMSRFELVERVDLMSDHSATIEAVRQKILEG